ncbi:hypothetical protein [Shewanella sp. UCD-KL12]|uniref:hypothetical protein n=1 Tax=Shewanella sp. UCD-KL12 TaxID=1917163 RepID=UPI000970C3FC|nr:hypothetical protein [Shewanella sp. UCD-KL12]
MILTPKEKYQEKCSALVSTTLLALGSTLALVLSLVLGLSLSFTTWAATQAAPQESSLPETQQLALTSLDDNKLPLIAIEVGVDLSGMEGSVNQAAESITEMANALTTLAENPQLDAEQQQNILAIIGRIDTLAQGFNTSLNKLPDAVKQSSKPIVTASENMLSDLKLAVILVFVLLLLLIIIVLIAIYYSVLQPTKQILVETTGKLSHMATAMESTAHIIEASNEHHQKILESIERHQEQFSAKENR